MTIGKLKEIGKKQLKNLEDGNIKAHILLGFILNMSNSELVIYENKSVDEQDVNAYLQYLNEVKEGYPVQYITHNQAFMGLDFYVDENVLIPQPDTEILVEEAIRVINEKNTNIAKDINKREKVIDAQEINQEEYNVLDLCTGSGAIAISIAKYTNAKVYASDVSNEALNVARKNAKKHETNIEFINSDMFNNIEKNDFDIIVSNPPYIEKSTIPLLDKEVQSEPQIALDGGDDGLDFYRIISEQAYRFLKKYGSLMLEIAYNQKNSVSELLAQNEHYSNIECIKDLAGNDRVIIARVNKI